MPPLMNTTRRTPWVGACFLIAAALPLATDVRANCTNPYNGTPLAIAAGNQSTATVLKNPEVYVIFWGLTTTNDSAHERALLTQFLPNLGASKYLNAVVQYASQSGSPGNPQTLYKDAWTDTTVPTTYPSTSEIALEITFAIGVMHWTPGDDAIFILALPAPLYKPGECGSHHSIHISGHTNDLMYIEFPYQAQLVNGTALGLSCYTAAASVADGTTIGLVHELAETITDPRPNGTTKAYVDSFDCEIGDKCQGGSFPVQQVNISANSTLYGVPQLWSNATSSCVFAYQTRHDWFYLSTILGSPTLVHISEDGPSLAADSWGAPAATLRAGVRPAAVSLGYRNIDVFVPRTDNHLAHAGAFLPSSPVWDDWGALPSPYVLTGSPSAASWGPGRLDVFALGQNGGTVHLFHRYWDGSLHSWSDWGSPAGVTMTAGVGATAVSATDVDFFVTDGTNIYQGGCNAPCTTVVWSSGSWGHQSGHTIAGAPEASSWYNRLTVSYVSTSGALSRRIYDSGTLYSWGDYGGPSDGLLPSPGAVGAGEGRTFYGGVGPGTQLWELYYNNAPGSWQSPTLLYPDTAPVDVSSW